MEIDPQYFEERKAKAEQLYASRRTIYNPYLDCEVVLNSDGFHHLLQPIGRASVRGGTGMKHVEYWANGVYARELRTERAGGHWNVLVGASPVQLRDT